jgi:hypothetical protein
MAVYCSTTSVYNILPGDTDVSTTQVDEYIADASRWIDANLTTLYNVPFADRDDSPGTPEYIAQVAKYQAAQSTLEFMGLVNNVSEVSKIYGDKAQQLIDDLKPTYEEGVRIKPVVQVSTGWKGLTGTKIIQLDTGETDEDQNALWYAD